MTNGQVAIIVNAVLWTILIAVLVFKVIKK